MERHRSAIPVLLLGVCLLVTAVGCGGVGAYQSGALTQAGAGSSSNGSTSAGSSGGSAASGTPGSSSSGSGDGSGNTGASGGSSGSSGGGTGASSSGSSSAAGGGISIVPADAISVTGIQDLSGWKATYDTATSGSSGAASGTMSIVTSPSRDGAAREFDTSYTNSGGERYSVGFGQDATATNFLYDGWIDLPDNSTDIANLELDMNQVMLNGQTVIYGFQCDGYSGTWDYSGNVGTPESYQVQWMKSKAACNVKNWSRNTWHHVQVAYSRDDAGNVTYKSVWLDGTKQDINATVNAAFALGWARTLLTNLQVDGRGASGSATVYLDDLTVYRW